MSIAIGDRIPSIAFTEGTPATQVGSAELFGSGKHLIFGVPGAFTPGCDKTHLPGYLADAEAFAAKGIQSMACIAVNDAYVMHAWGESQNVQGKVRMLADVNAEFTLALGLEVHAGGLGGTRSKRYAMVVEDGAVTHLEVEPDSFGLSCSLAPNLLERL